MDISNPIIFLSAMAPLIPLLIGMVFFNRFENYRKLLVLLMGLSLTVQLVVHYQFSLKWNNQLLFHLYTPLEFAILGSIFRIWFKGWWLEKVIPYLIGGFTIFALVNAVSFNHLIAPIPTPLWSAAFY